MKASFGIFLLATSLVGTELVQPVTSHAATVAANVTRRQFTLELAQQLHLQPAVGAAQTFKDLPSGDPAFSLIMAASLAGWISGYPDGSFRPGASLTREQVAKFEVIALGLSAQAASLADKTPSYGDAGEIGKWAWGYVNEAQTIGILHGFSQGTFGPQSTFTQPQIVHAEAQMAAYLATTPVKAFPAAPTAVRGNAAGTSQITLTPYASSDRVAVVVSSSPLSIPTWGATLPTSATLYSPGDDLPVTAGAYVGIYEVGSANSVVAFSQLQVNPAEIAQPPQGLSLTGPAGGAVSSATAIGPFTLTLVDQSGNPAPAPVGGETISLASNSTGAHSFAATASGAGITALTVPAGSTSATFYYGDEAAGAPVLLAASTSLGSATLGVPIAAGAPAKIALSGPQSGVSSSAAGIGPFSLALTDAYGNPSPAPAGGVAVNLASSSGGPDEFSSAASGPPESGVVIPQGSATAIFYYGDAMLGQPTLTASAPGLTSGSAAVQVVATAATELIITGPATGAVSSAASAGPYTVTLADASGQPVPAPAGGVTVSLASSSVGPDEFSSAAGGPPESAVVIPQGSATAIFYYGDAMPGQPTLAATAPGLANGSATVQVIAATATELTITGPATGSVSSAASGGPYTVTLADASGQPVPAPAGGILVALSANSSGTQEFSQSPAGPATTSVMIPAGISSATFYYGDTQAGVVALVASAPPLSPAETMIELAQPVSLQGLGLDSPANPATTSQVQAWVAKGLRNIFLNTFAPSFAQQYLAALPYMDVVLFQGYWTSAFTTESGAQRAQEAINQAEAVGYPKGAYIFVDVESTGRATEQQMITWINSWSAAVQAAGYGAGVYFGVPQPVRAADTAQLLADRFWKSYSGTSITPTPRGYVVLQTGTTSQMDTDTFVLDNLGEASIGAGI